MYFHNTVKPHFTDSDLIRTPRSLLRTVCFVPGKECLTANVEKTGTSQRRNNNSFNNNKSLAVQDESDNLTHHKRKHTRATYSSNTMPQAPPAGVTFSLNST